MAIRADTVATAAEIFDGETVIIHFGRGAYFSLSGAGPAIWALLQRPTSSDAVAAALVAVAGGDPAAVGAATAAFVERLRGEDLVFDVAEGEEPLPPLDDALRAGAAAAPGIEVFTDLADLIALDPVHEVEVLAGWPRRPADAAS